MYDVFECMKAHVEIKASHSLTKRVGGKAAIVVLYVQMRKMTKVDKLCYL